MVLPYGHGNYIFFLLYNQELENMEVPPTIGAVCESRCPHFEAEASSRQPARRAASLGLKDQSWPLALHRERGSSPSSLPSATSLNADEKKNWLCSAYCLTFNTSANEECSISNPNLVVLTFWATLIHSNNCELTP